MRSVFNPTRPSALRTTLRRDDFLKSRESIRYVNVYRQTYLYSANYEYPEHARCHYSRAQGTPVASLPSWCNMRPMLCRGNRRTRMSKRSRRERKKTACGGRLVCTLVIFCMILIINYWSQNSTKKEILQRHARAYGWAVQIWKMKTGELMEERGEGRRREDTA